MMGRGTVVDYVERSIAAATGRDVRGLTGRDRNRGIRSGHAKLVDAPCAVVWRRCTLVPGSLCGGTSATLHDAQQVQLNVAVL